MYAQMHGLLWLLYLAVFAFHDNVSSQCLPPITCPKHFQYISEGNEFYGKITLLRLPKTSITVDLELTQHDMLKSDYVGNLTMIEDLDTTEANLLNGNPITYRVKFATQSELPKVTRLAVNSVEICHDPKPSKTIALQHRFHPKTVTERVKSTLLNSFNVNYKFSRDEDAEKEHTAATTVAQIGLTKLTTMTPESRLSLQPLTNNQLLPKSSISECGIVGGGPFFIFSGSMLSRGQFPWLTAIYRKHYTSTQFICGGSLISSRTVITAAHCFKLLNLKAQEVLVFLGRHNLHDYSEDNIIARDATTLLLHPDYKENTYPDADLALVQLNMPVRFGQYIKPICLWSEPTDKTFIIGQTAIVAGWGADESEGSLLTQPRMVETYFIDPPTCLRAGEAFSNLTSLRTICASSRDGIGLCMGDSGGGLMMKRDGVWVLRGVVSAGQNSDDHCSLREFVMYCDVAKHLSWIQRNMLS